MTKDQQLHNYRYALRGIVALIVLAGFLAGPDLHAQSWLWAQKGGGTRADTVGGIGIDGERSSYVVGTYTGEVTFGPTTFMNGPNVGLFMVKYSQSGGLLWTAQGNGAGNFRRSAIAVDADGNFYITGGFSGTVNFAAVSLTSAGGYDIFIAKYNSIGILQWAKREGGPEDDLGGGIAIDSVGNVFVAGTFNGTMLVGEFDLISAGLSDIVVIKYSSLGELQWASRSGGAGTEVVNGIGVDGLANSYVAGSFTGSLEVGGRTLNAGANPDALVMKFDRLGAAEWGTDLGGDSTESGLAIVADRFGNSYVTGSFVGTGTFGATSLTSAGEGDIFIAKLDGVGVVRWGVRAGGSGEDAGRAIAIDQLGNSYVTGSFRGSAGFGATTLTSAGADDIFVARYDGSGTVQWAKNGGGARSDVGRGIDVDEAGEAYVAGSFDTTTTIGLTTLNGTGGTDVFTARLGKPATITTGEIVGSPFCAGATVSVPFAVGGIFAPDNVFTAELSDSAGSFSTPTQLGALNSSQGGTIIARIPDGVKTGLRYRIRVTASNPVVNGADNGIDLMIFGSVIPEITPPNPVKLCEGESVTLDAGPNYTSYQWSTGAVTRTIRVSQPGSYSVTVSNQAGCVGTSAAAVVTLLPAPEKPVISRLAQYLESSVGDSYEWFIDGELIQGEGSRRIIPPRPGIYTVRVTAANGCSSTSDPYVLAASVPDEGDASLLSIYPHPNRGTFTMELSFERPSMVRASIIDALGREVARYEELGATGSYRRVIELEGEPAGIYILRLEADGKRWVREIIKQ